jgi:hypothetical protein
MNTRVSELLHQRAGAEPEAQRAMMLASHMLVKFVYAPAAISP